MHHYDVYIQRRLPEADRAVPIQTKFSHRIETPIPIPDPVATDAVVHLDGGGTDVLMVISVDGGDVYVTPARMRVNVITFTNVDIEE